MKNNTLNSVLIVEDDRESNENIAFFLRSRFKTVLSAYDGIEGWSLYNDEVPDLIITDIEMPNMDGLELVQKIRQIDIETPIIIISAFTHHEYLMKAIPLNLIDYLVKPLTFRKFIDCLKSVYSKYSFEQLHSSLDSIGYLSYDWEAKIAYTDDQKIQLTNKEIQIIELLLINYGQVLNYDEITNSLYPDSFDSRNAIKCIIRDIRKKLPSISIETLPKWGYKLL